MGEMIVTDQQPASMDRNPGDNPNPDVQRDATGADGHGAGTRLRRALDIARQAGKPPTAPRRSEPEPPPAPAADRAPSVAAATEPAADLPAATWEASVQGWVRRRDGALEWRPIVATADRLEGWEIGTYLGIATGQAESATSAGAAGAPAALTRARTLAIARLVEDAVARGAHGVVAVHVSMTDTASGTLIHAAGTAVTLTNRL